MSLAVDVISDVICPWCYIGKRRLEILTLVTGELFRLLELHLLLT